MQPMMKIWRWRNGQNTETIALMEVLTLFELDGQTSFSQ